VLFRARNVLQFFAHLRDDLAAADLLRRRQRVLQRCDDPLGAAWGDQRTAGVAGEANHLHAEFLANPGEAFHIAPPPTPELEGIHTRRLDFGGAILEGYVRKQGVDADRQTRLCRRGRHVGAKGDVSLDRGAGGGRRGQAKQLATRHGSAHGVVSSTR